MEVKIALAGNPNCGKTTLFNALTGSNQFTGNWPGVTVEKKEGRLKKHKDVIITDLPGIYSLSPYTLEEVIARKYLLEEKPDVILNLLDGTNLERNLYLSTQLAELGIPMVLAVNMMDLVHKNGDQLDLKKLEQETGCPVVEICALKEKGMDEVVREAMEAARNHPVVPYPQYSREAEDVLKQMDSILDGKNVPEHLRRWYALRLFEGEESVQESLQLSPEDWKQIRSRVEKLEDQLEDDAQSIITNERYTYIEEKLAGCLSRKAAPHDLSLSDKIDRIVTNRWLGLPIFVMVMFLVYWISMVGIGKTATDWTNDNLFGDGLYFSQDASAAYEEATEAWQSAQDIVDGYELYTEEYGTPASGEFTYTVVDEETLASEKQAATLAQYEEAAALLEEGEEPDPADYGTWIPGIPVLAENLLNALHVSETGMGAMVRGLVLEGIVAGVGAVLGFVPQMLVLFFLLAFLEACGYMARIAFVLDRIFRKFGLSGKSFIPMLIGTGCGVPGIMASRTIENERDRRMTIMTTTFIPCGAKIPFISMVAGAIFGGGAWVATSAYFLGMAAIIVSGMILKKTSMFAGNPAPFVMELPAYHWPTLKNVTRSMWERGWSFIQKAGTIILLSTIFVWFMSYFGFTAQGFRMLESDELNLSLMASLGNAIAWIFQPLGWGTWQATVASITGLVAKENIVGTLGILYGNTDTTVYQNLHAAFTMLSGYSFLAFNLLCAPCFAAIGAIRREMNSAKWTWFAIGYQCGFAYAIALMIYQFGLFFEGIPDLSGLSAALIVLAIMLYLLLRPYKESMQLGHSSHRLMQRR